MKKPIWKKCDNRTVYYTGVPGFNASILKPSGINDYYSIFIAGQGPWESKNGRQKTLAEAKAYVERIMPIRAKRLAKLFSK